MLHRLCILRLSKIYVVLRVQRGPLNHVGNSNDASSFRSLFNFLRSSSQLMRMHPLLSDQPHQYLALLSQLPSRPE